MTRNPNPFLPALVTQFALAALAAPAALLAVSGCGSARKSEIPEARFQSDPQLAQGRIVFMHTCNQCHVLGGPGLGPGLNDKPLPALAIRTQVRKGVGAMPAFSESELSDAQLDAVVEYLQELRRQEARWRAAEPAPAGAGKDAPSTPV